MGIFDIFNTSAANNAAADQTASTEQGLGALNTSYQQGQNQLQTNYTAGLQPFLQNYSTANAGQTQLANALGLNGASGNAAAVAGFENNPGYQFAKQEGINAVDANQARTGQLTSGNTNLDVGQWVTNNANQNWNQYVQNLEPYNTAANNAATGIGGLYAGLGTQLNQSSQGEGQAGYGADTSIGNAQANAALAANNASANTMGAVTGLASSLFGFA